MEKFASFAFYFTWVFLFKSNSNLFKTIEIKKVIVVVLLKQNKTKKKHIATCFLSSLLYLEKPKVPTVAPLFRHNSKKSDRLWNPMPF